MFKENVDYQQYDLFGFESKLTAKQKQYFNKSVESSFFVEIFHQIDEKDFACLYANGYSRPNVPVNQLVGALILKHLKNWTYADLFNNLNFNLLTRYAIGITDTEVDIFAEASIFNFQNRLIAHYESTEKDLINDVFKKLTSAQLSKYKVNTKIQRGDSFLVGSNVIDYSKLHLLLEVLHRLDRIVSSEDKTLYPKQLSRYLEKTSEGYVFKLKRADLADAYVEVAQIYYILSNLLDKQKYEGQEAYSNFERIYKEFFEVKDNGLQLKPNGEFSSGDLHSPDDPGATYTKKYGKTNIGYSTHISETQHTKDELGLITDIVVVQNNVSDDCILASRLEQMVEQTPDIAEYFADSAYGNKEVDELNKKYGITQYQGTVKGRPSPSEIRIHNTDGVLKVSCSQGQSVPTEATSKRYKAIFDIEKCSQCPISTQCKVKKSGGKRVQEKRIYYFEDKDILAHERIHNIKKLPKEKRTIRANVEATVKEMKRGMNNGKVRVRRWIRVSMHMLFTGIAVNLRRIQLNKRKMA